ncbi:multidrug transporter [Oceaniferula spumae]|uniref:Multidrug transporter n=1 Tax=Oceaniferula spumae TaxID=2979115 RepID=A0AAT9FPS6_9BACT
MNTKAIFGLILCCAFWGVSFPVIKAMMIELRDQSPEASTLFFSSWVQAARFLLAGIFMFFLTVRLTKPTVGEIHQGLLLAFWGGIGMWLQADGLAYTEASTSAFLTQSYCIFLPLWAAIRHRKLPGKPVIISVLLVIVGGAILAGVRPNHLHLGRGEITTIASAVFLTFQILVLEKPKFSTNRGRSVTLVMCFGIAAIFLPATFLTAPDVDAVINMGNSISVIALLTVLAIVCTVGSFSLMNTYQRHVSSTEAGLIYTTEPVFAACYALFLPSILAGLMGHHYANERLSSQLLIGGSLIVIANLVIIHAMSKRRLPTKSPTT